MPILLLREADGFIQQFPLLVLVRILRDDLFPAVRVLVRVREEVTIPKLESVSDVCIRTAGVTLDENLTVVSLIDTQ